MAASFFQACWRRRPPANCSGGGKRQVTLALGAGFVPCTRQGKRRPRRRYAVHCASLRPVLGAKAVGKAGALIDGAHGVELGRPLGPADQMGAVAGGLERLIETARRLLAGADDDAVGYNQLWAAVDLDVAAGIVDLAVGNAAQLGDVALGQGQTQRPAGAEPQPAAHPARLAL